MPRPSLEDLIEHLRRQGAVLQGRQIVFPDGSRWEVLLSDESLVVVHGPHGLTQVLDLREKPKPEQEERWRIREEQTSAASDGLELHGGEAEEGSHEIN